MGPVRLVERLLAMGLKDWLQSIREMISKTDVLTEKVNNVEKELVRAAQDTKERVDRVHGDAKERCDKLERKLEATEKRLQQLEVIVQSGALKTLLEKHGELPTPPPPPKALPDPGATPSSDN